MYLLNKSEFVFDKISSSIEKQKNFEKHNKIGNRAAKSGKELRVAKRTYYYKFELIDGIFHYSIVEKDSIPINISLNKNEFALNVDFVGYFKGSEFKLVDILDQLANDYI